MSSFLVNIFALIARTLSGIRFNRQNCPGGSTPYSELYWEAPPEGGAFFKAAVYKRVGKFVILVYERVTKSAAKW